MKKRYWALLIVFIGIVAVAGFNITGNMIADINYENDQPVFLQAINSFDSSLCSTIKTLSLRDSCFSSIAVSNSDYSLCTSIDDLKKLYACSAQIAITKHDLAMCNEIKGEDDHWSDTCFSNVGVFMKDVSVCTNIVDSGVKDKCFFDISIALSNTEGCLNVLETTKKIQCYSNVAKATLDFNICNHISNINAVSRDSCVYSVAKLSKNIEICHEVKFSKIKEQCFTDLLKIVNEEKGSAPKVSLT